MSPISFSAAQFALNHTTKLIGLPFRLAKIVWMWSVLSVWTVWKSQPNKKKFSINAICVDKPYFL